MARNPPKAVDRIDEIPRTVTVDTLTEAQIEIVRVHASIVGRTDLGEWCRIAALPAARSLTVLGARWRICEYLRTRARKE